LRTARKSKGGFGNSSDGGCGGPIEAHAVIITAAPTAISSLPKRIFIQKKTDYQNSTLPPAEQTDWRKCRSPTALSSCA
jgi:hypothetical protein